MYFPRFQLPLSGVLALVFLSIFCLPLAGLGVAQVYQSALVRQTEAELIVQGAVIGAAYSVLMDTYTGKKPTMVESNPSTRWKPRPAQLDLQKDTVQSPLSLPILTEQTPDPMASQIGQALLPVIRQAQEITLAGIRIADTNGVIVATTSDQGLGNSLENHSIFQAARQQKTIQSALHQRTELKIHGNASISRDTGFRVAVALPVVKQGKVLAVIELIRTPIGLGTVLWHQRSVFLQGFLFILLIILGLAWGLSRGLVRPLKRVIAQAHAGEKVDFKQIDNTYWRIEELDELSESIQKMAKNLRERADYMRHFSTHISHEFKSPLSAILAACELLQDSIDSMKNLNKKERHELPELIDLIKKQAEKLEKWVHELLHLARAEMPCFEVNQIIDFSVIIDNFTYHDLNIHKKNDTKKTNILINIPENIIYNLLNQLSLNAIQHGHAKNLYLAYNIKDNLIYLHISNDGLAISANTAKRLFTPFFTTARENGNTGLGLLTLRALLQAHGGNITLNQPEYCEFIIQIPLK